MPGHAESRSFLYKLKVCNLGCVGPDGVEITLDEIVCLVGVNNAGKSTVLRAYEAAATGAELKFDEVYSVSPEIDPAFIRATPTVELWVHIPAGAENIDAKWKEQSNGMLLVRSKWTWPTLGGKPIRTTWDPEKNEYSEDGNAAGLDNVFNSRLPRPFRIGSLDDPADEHKKLLELVLDPIKKRLGELMNEDGSALKESIKKFIGEAEKPVAEFKEDLEQVQQRVSKSYRRVFNTARIQFSVSLGDVVVDPAAALVKSSHVGVVGACGQTKWQQQGTGSQRALFWSMLEVRSELSRIAEKRKIKEKQSFELQKELGKQRGKLPGLSKPAAVTKCQAEIQRIEDELAALGLLGGESVGEPESFLPGYMLLIDEPETALHPAAIRAAKDHLYSLAAESGWQVMLSTHHPAFIDPLKDHTTIVRLHRPETHAPPNVYRSDSVAFTPQEKETLKSLLAFDQAVAEMFFSQHVIIVEGDTEFASFTVVMDAAPESFPHESRPLILRARGKWTIPLLVRMLSHFKVSCSVLHDVDSPRTGKSGNRNGAYTANGEITNAIRSSRESGVHVVHRCSVPDFERNHGMELPSKDKPFNAWNATKNDVKIASSVSKVLGELVVAPTSDSLNHPDDGMHYENKCKVWAKSFAPGDPAFDFS